MIDAKGYAAPAANKPLVPFSFERRDVGPHDVRIAILFCGVCHSDIHQARNEWGSSMFPMVPGHEIVGRVTEVGAHVKSFSVGDLAGVGCMVDSCQHCAECNEGLEQYCDNGFIGTYSAKDKDGSITQGGYSNNIVVTRNSCFTSPRSSICRAWRRCCAPVSPLGRRCRQWKAKAGDRVAVIGLGGLGHMAVKFAAAMGCEVTVLSTSPGKEADAKALGAHKFVVTKDENAMKGISNYFDLIINTVSAPIDLMPYVASLRLDGTMVLLGVPPEAAQLHAFNLIAKRRRIAGSLIGGIQETQDMLDFCAEHNVMSDVEVINIDYINEAYERMMQSDVKYRFVIDMDSLKG